MELYGKGSDTIEKLAFKAIRSPSTDNIISLKVRVVDPLKPVSTQPEFPKVEIEIPIYL